MTSARSLSEGLRRSVRGIRPRVVVAYVLLMLSALVIANLVVRQVLLSRLDQSIEATLAQEVEELRQLVGGIDPSTGEPFGEDVESLLETFLSRNVPEDGEAYFSVVDGRPFLTSFDPPVQLLSDDAVLDRINAARVPERFNVDTRAGEARILVAPLGSAEADSDEVLGAFVVAFFPADEREQIDQEIALVAAVSAVVLLLASVVAWTLAGRVLRPVARLTETATSITESDLSARIPVQGDDELARLGHTFNSMLDRLELAATTQRQFLNDIAHDLRTPLTIVQGHLEMLGGDPDERAETLELVDDELDRMGRYVSDLLILAKAEQPDFLRLGLVDLGEWAEDLLANARRLGDRTFEMGDAPEPGVAFAELDAERMSQAVLNLVLNSVQHTAPGDEIRLGVRVLLGEVVVSVHDTGPGIDPELLPQLFERASRGDRSRVARREGTGLGLAIVAAIADAHGGRVDVVSEPGEGASFTIAVPLDPAGRVGFIVEEES